MLLPRQYLPKRLRCQTWLGAVLGTVGALADAYSSDRIRKFFVMNLKVSRLLVSFVEDAVAIVLGLLDISYFVS
jgi:uncharacterized membrane protein